MYTKLMRFFTMVLIHFALTQFSYGNALDSIVLTKEIFQATSSARQNINLFFYDSTGRKNSSYQISKMNDVCDTLSLMRYDYVGEYVYRDSTFSLDASINSPHVENVHEYSYNGDGKILYDTGWNVTATWTQGNSYYYNDTLCIKIIRRTYADSFYLDSSLFFYQNGKIIRELKYVRKIGAATIDSFHYIYNSLNDKLDKKISFQNNGLIVIDSLIYDGSNRLSGQYVTYNNGVLWNYTLFSYDEYNRLIRKELHRPNGELKEYYAYEYNAVKNSINIEKKKVIESLWGKRLNVFPNPYIGGAVINIDLNNLADSPIKINCFDIQGRKIVKEIQITNKRLVNFKLPNLQTGLVVIVAENIHGYKESVCLVVTR